ncbi:MAG: class II glutamine amidotransferase [Bdellovibrio sp. CG12_big_fil_rev_8_21_14_0_65_39_13]|nr:MAG: class II glutamine amidotransferase [Bdellovibrio sp. CG22_combo_CG10-13_8_21_14_all_39_27]PIQ58439.1 MAG: class II glutamine amidotransferase [Bdellovibrio sp. CG12_big_fil_rev_8_21_14_0_65_39_13]PIR35392.1 MAG: class II glutamine amidotransferase [Bdellovibrio sp. CG11_big_fil_rev_8_21_14_0_20_39_38]
MCRMLGFRSVINSQVHSSLMSAENSLVHQSNIHPDGWGVAYYMAGAPHIIKSDISAFKDSLFSKVSGIVSSQTVIAHIRKATEGEVNILNTHPFQFGRWVFAHNGHVRNFISNRPKLLKLIDADLGRFILGSTDSEIIFFIVLSFIKKSHSLENEVPYSVVRDCITMAIDEICKIIGPFCASDVCGEEAKNENFLSFLITDGKMMLAHQGGKPLYYSTYKKKCPERDTCPSFASACESLVTEDAKVMHFLISSEPLQGHNVWNLIPPAQIIGVDKDLKLKTS